MKFLIDNFGVSNLFGRENYEYYARISGRVLKVEENWIFAFKYPPDTFVPSGDSQQQSSPLLCAASTSTSGAGCIYIKSGFAIPAGLLSCDGSSLADDAYARLSMSLEENVFRATWLSNSNKESPTSGTGVLA